MTSNANSIFGKRLLTGCYQTITLADSDGTDSFTPVPATNNCASLTTTIITNGRKYLDAQPSSVIASCQLNLAKFCCVVLEPIPVAEEASFPNIDYFDLGTPEGLRKWRAVQVQCKVN